MAVILSHSQCVEEQHAQVNVLLMVHSYTAPREKALFLWLIVSADYLPQTANGTFKPLK